MPGESHFIEFSKPFIDAAKNVFETMIFTKLETQKPQIKSDAVSRGDISAVLGLSGDMEKMADEFRTKLCWLFHFHTIHTTSVRAPCLVKRILLTFRKLPISAVKLLT